MTNDMRHLAAECLTKLRRAESIAAHEVTRIDGERVKLERLQAADRGEAELFGQSIIVWNAIMERTARQNLEKVVERTNEALKVIVTDLDLRLEVKPQTKWDKQVYAFTVLDGGKARSGTSGTGGTVLAVVSLILRVMFILQTKRAKVLVLDESLRFISAGYKAQTSAFLKSLAQAYGVHILLVTHDVDLAVSADHHYAAVRPKADREIEGSVIRELTTSEVAAYFQSQV